MATSPTRRNPATARSAQTQVQRATVAKAAPTTSVEARPGSSYRGDTLSAIAARLKAQGIPGSTEEIIQAIMSMNPQIKNPNLIIAGDTLKLPTGERSSFTSSPASKGPSISGGSRPSYTPPASSSSSESAEDKSEDPDVAKAEAMLAKRQQEHSYAQEMLALDE
jgi:hypothetical protein